MKTSLSVVAVFVCLGGATAGAMTYLGPPTTRVKAGQWSVGGLWSDSKQDVELERSIELDDLDQEVVAATVSVGLADRRAELFGIFGATELERNRWETGDEFLIGFGGRITTNPVNEDLDWGICGQFTYFQSEDRSVLIAAETDYELNAVEIEIGFGPCWRPGPFIVYGGPYINWIEGDVESDVDGDFDINVDDWFGVYIGAGIDMDNGVQVTAELQATPDGTCVGIGGRFAF